MDWNKGEINILKLIMKYCKQVNIILGYIDTCSMCNCKINNLFYNKGNNIYCYHCHKYNLI